MRLLILALIVALSACTGDAGNKTEPANAVATQVSSPQSTSPLKQSAPAASGELPSATAIADMNVPLMGGAADFTVKVKGAQPGLSNLIGFYAEEHFRADTTRIQPDGTIRFKKEEGYPQGFYYVSYAENQYVQIILGEDQTFKIEADINNIPGTIQASGSPDIEAYYANQKFEQTYNAEYGPLGKQLKDAEGTPAEAALKEKQKQLLAGREAHLNGLFNKYPKSLFTPFKKAGQNPTVREDVPDEKKVFYYRKEFWDNVDFSDKRLLRTPVVNNKLKRYFDELTAQNPDSIISSIYSLVDRTVTYPEYNNFFVNWLLNKYEPGKVTLMDAEAIHVRLTQRYITKEKAPWADSMYVYSLQNRAYEMGQSLIGQDGPNVTAQDLDGNTHTLLDKTADYLVVYLFTPSCEHCMEQTPKLIDWYNEWKNKGGDVYAIAIDTDEQELGDYVKKTGMPFTYIYDSTNRSIYAKYYVNVTPELYVLNKERKIIGKNLKVFQIETIINQDKAKR